MTVDLRKDDGQLARESSSADAQATHSSAASSRRFMTLFSVGTSIVRSRSRREGRSFGEKMYEKAVRKEVEAVVLSWTSVLLPVRRAD